MLNFAVACCHRPYWDTFGGDTLYISDQVGTQVSTAKWEVGMRCSCKLARSELFLQKMHLLPPTKCVYWEASLKLPFCLSLFQRTSWQLQGITLASTLMQAITKERYLRACQEVFST
eukprot:1159604-Pelagomonas_calceolata.AAC.2